MASGEQVEALKKRDASRGVDILEKARAVLSTLSPVNLNRNVPRLS